MALRRSSRDLAHREAGVRRPSEPAGPVCSASPGQALTRLTPTTMGRTERLNRVLGQSQRSKRSPAAVAVERHTKGEKGSVRSRASFTHSPGGPDAVQGSSTMGLDFSLGLPGPFNYSIRLTGGDGQQQPEDLPWKWMAAPEGMTWEDTDRPHATRAVGGRSVRAVRGGVRGSSGRHRRFSRPCPVRGRLQAG